MEGCTCAALDVKLGGVFSKLPNLRTLSFWCRYRHPVRAPKHTWVTTVKIPNLRELEFSCPDHPWKNKEYKSFLSAPCMSTVEVLQLDIGDYSEALRSLFTESPNLTLSKVTTIISNNSAPVDQILSRRRIKNLVYVYLHGPSGPSELVRTQKEGLLRLRLLYMPDIGKWISSVNDVSPYVNLVRIGSVKMKLSTSDEETLQIIQPFSFLMRLELIEFAFDREGFPTWGDQFFTGVEAQHPSLTRIYKEQVPGGDNAYFILHIHKLQQAPGIMINSLHLFPGVLPNS
ncbi:hypothetical protein FRC17_008365, partial [Serendipita sp. 399]